MSAIFSYLNLHLIATAFCSVTQGVSVSGIYPLSLALASEFNLHLTDQQISTIMITMMVSEAIMVAPTGYLMQNVYPRVFFIALFFFNLAVVFNSRYVLTLMQK